MKRILSSLALTGVLIFQTACGGGFATSLRVVVAAGAPILNLLVQQGKISPALKDGLIADLANEGYKIGDMATCLNAAPKGDKLKHLQCVQTLEQSAETRKLLRDFGSNPAVQNIADDFDAIIQGAIIYFGGSPTPGVRRAAAPLPTTESELKARVQKLKRDLGQ